MGGCCTYKQAAAQSSTGKARSEHLQDDLGILGMTLDMVWSFLLGELHDNGPVDLVNPGGMDKAYANIPDGE